MRKERDWGKFTKYGNIIIINPDLFDKVIAEL